MQVYCSSLSSNAPKFPQEVIQKPVALVGYAEAIAQCLELSYEVKFTSENLQSCILVKR